MLGRIQADFSEMRKDELFSNQVGSRKPWTDVACLYDDAMMGRTLMMDLARQMGSA